MWRWRADPQIGGDQSKSLPLRDGLKNQGLQNCENEWSHFTFKPAAMRHRYGTVAGVAAQESAMRLDRRVRHLVVSCSGPQGVAFCLPLEG